MYSEQAFLFQGHIYLRFFIKLLFVFFAFFFLIWKIFWLVNFKHIIFYPFKIYVFYYRALEGKSTTSLNILVLKEK